MMEVKGFGLCGTNNLEPLLQGYWQKLIFNGCGVWLMIWEALQKFITNCDQPPLVSEKMYILTKTAREKREI